MSATDNRLQRLQEAQATVHQILLGKDHQVNLAFCCLLARGHLLIEDLPGVGKTTLAHLLARTLGLEYARIQFTSDLLPADVLERLVPLLLILFALYFLLSPRASDIGTRARIGMVWFALSSLVIHSEARERDRLLQIPG